MLGWRRWTPEEDTYLEQLWRNGMFDDEISVEIKRTVKAIRLRRERLGLLDESPEVTSMELYSEVAIPRFEDVTKAEARAISANAPPSGRFRIESRWSLTGSTAAMCAENELWKRSPRKY